MILGEWTKREKERATESNTLKKKDFCSCEISLTVGLEVLSAKIPQAVNLQEVGS